MVTGTSDTLAAGFGPLPFDLTAVGMDGCSMLCDVLASQLRLGATSGTDTFSLAIPNSVNLAGVEFLNQGYALDPGINVLGAINSNAGRGTIQP